MKKTIMMIAMAAAMLPAFASAADVNGVWVRDAKSDPFPDTMYWLVRGAAAGNNNPQAFVLTVQQNPTSLVVTNPARKMRNIALDGRARVVPTDTGVEEATVTAVNAPNAVTITTTQPYGGMPGNAELTVKETWTVSPDRNVLTITTVRSSPAATKTDTQVFNRRS